MQESRYDGRDVLTGHPTQEQIDRALADPRNRAVTLHKPGSTVMFGDDQYIVQFDGSWKRVLTPLELHAEALKRRIRQQLGGRGGSAP